MYGSAVLRFLLAVLCLPSPTSMDAADLAHWSLGVVALVSEMQQPAPGGGGSAHTDICGVRRVVGLLSGGDAGAACAAGDGDRDRDAMRPGSSGSGVDRRRSRLAQKAAGVRPCAQFSVSSAAPWM